MYSLLLYSRSGLPSCPLGIRPKWRDLLDPSLGDKWLSSCRRGDVYSISRWKLYVHRALRVSDNKAGQLFQAVFR